MLNRGVSTRGIVAWAYTKPAGVEDFGAYELFAHDRGELVMFPAVPPLRGDHTKLVLKRKC